MIDMNPHSTSSNEEVPVQRVLFICHDFPPHRYAGAQLYALMIAKELRKRGVHVDIFHPIFRKETAHDYAIHSDTFEGLDVYKLSKPRHEEHEKYMDLRAARAFRQWMQGRSYDLVHVHGLGQLSAAILHELGEMPLPVMMTLHDFWLLCDSWHMVDHTRRSCDGPTSPEKCAECYLRRSAAGFRQENVPAATHYQRLRREVMARAFSAVDLAIAPSRFLADQFAKFGMPGVRVHQNGLVRSEPVAKPPRQQVVFGYFGQIILRKGIDIMLAAFAHPSMRDIQLEVHGKIYEKEYGKRITGMAEKLPNVQLYGAYDPARLAELYATVDVALVPSRMDNYPTTVLEAFMNRTPVIGAKIGGIPEMIRHGENGLLFEKESADALREMVLQCHQQPELVRRMTSAVQPPRTVEEDLAGLLAHYRNLLEKQAPTAPSIPSKNRVQTQPESASPSPVAARLNTSAHPASSSNGKLRVLFLMLRNVHNPVLLPIIQRLRQDPRVEIMLIAPDYNVQRDELRSLGLPMRDWAKDLEADVGFMADNFETLLPGCRYVINVGHGLLSKGQYFTNSDFTPRENLLNLLCVPGEFHRQQLLASGKVKIPVLATGFSKLDPLFDGSMPTRDELLRRSGIDPAKKVVLYAPTFNFALSAIPILWMRIRHLATPDRVLLIKLHGSSIPQYFDHHRQLAEQHENILMIEDSDLTPYLALADVVVSDVSSAFMEAMLLDKPIVLFNSPNAEDYINYDPNDIDWTWRDMAEQVDTLEGLLAAVDRSLENPALKAERRAHYRSLLQVPTDGRASQRIIEAMWKLVEGQKKLRGNSWQREVVVLALSAQNLPDLEHLQEAAQAPVRAYLLEGGAATPQGYQHISRSEVTSLSGDAVVLLDPKFEGGGRWIFHLLNHLDQEVPGGVLPLYLNGEGAQGFSVPENKRDLIERPHFITPRLLASQQGNRRPAGGILRWSTGAWRLDSSGWVSVAQAIASGSQPRFEQPPEVALDVLLWPKKVTEHPASTPAGISSAPAPHAPERGVDRRERLIRHYQAKGELDKARDHLRRAMKEGELTPALQALARELELTHSGVR